MEKLHRVCKNFTRHDKKTRTILLCEMLEYTNVFLEVGRSASSFTIPVIFFSEPLARPSLFVEETLGFLAKMI